MEAKDKVSVRLEEEEWWRREAGEGTSDVVEEVKGWWLKKNCRQVGDGVLAGWPAGTFYAARIQTGGCAC